VPRRHIHNARCGLDCLPYAGHLWELINVSPARHAPHSLACGERHASEDAASKSNSRQRHDQLISKRSQNIAGDGFSVNVP
jgi:hypothetical protein